MKMTVEELIENCDDLPTLPDVYLRVKEVIEDPNASMVDMAKALSLDPAMTARMLKLVNSSFYGLSGKIETVSRAASILGMHPIHDLVLATAVASTFSNVQSSTMDMKTFWKSSVERGLLARVMAQAYNLIDSERLFVGGLLGDIGHLVMFHKIPDVAQEVLEKARAEARVRSTLETEIIGFHAGEVGAQLLESWNLPTNYQHSTRYHMDLKKAPDATLELGILHVAGIVEECQLLGVPRECWMEQTTREIPELQELKDEDLDRFLMLAQEELNLTLEMIVPALEHAA